MGSSWVWLPGVAVQGAGPSAHLRPCRLPLGHLGHWLEPPLVQTLAPSCCVSEAPVGSVTPVPQDVAIATGFAAPVTVIFECHLSLQD